MFCFTVNADQDITFGFILHEKKSSDVPFNINILSPKYELVYVQYERDRAITMQRRRISTTAVATFMQK